MSARQLEQLEGERVGAGGRLTAQVAAALQAGQHAEDFPGLAVQRTGELRLRERNRLLGKVLENVERLLERRHGILRATLFEAEELFLRHFASRVPRDTCVSGRCAPSPWSKTLADPRDARRGLALRLPPNV